MPRRLDKTLADYLVIAVSPALIMAMVGSLVFFLAELFYRGNYEGRVNFVLGCFVFAAVLIGRISIEFGAERAAMYAMPLALATALAINKFVVEQGGTLGSLGLLVNLGLLGLVWWAAHKLVWDCTLIDETQDSSGEGLLQRAGLVRRDKNGQNSQSAETEAPDEPPADEPEPPAEEPAPQTWWQRLRDAPRKPHAPGVWIVYFSLAALPIFGIGQAFIPASSLDQRRYVFILLVVYVASGLGLLLTTSFLGLRRYLRQRRLQMPITMAGVWITIGVVLIGIILGLAVLLPRPSAEYTLADLPIRFTSPEQKASRYAAGKEGADDRRPDRAKVTQDDPDKPKTGAAKDSPGGSAEGKKSESKGGEGKSGEGKAEQGKGEEGKKGRADDSSKPPPGKQNPGQEQGDAKQPPQQAGEKPSQAKQEPDRSGGGSRDSSRKTKPSQSSQESKSRSESKPDSSQRNDSPSAAPKDRSALLGEAMGWMLTLGKWLFYGALALVVLLWIIWHREQIMDEIRRILNELRQLWHWLFGGKPQQAQGAAEAEAGPQGPAPRRLSDFADPFATGEAARLSPDELVRYSFEALEAWAREHGCPRSPDETPHELAQQVADRDAALAHDARTLAGLYCRVAYAPGTLPPGQLEPLRQFWRQVLASTVRTA